ncbi:hypothetical protein RI129_007659 [Pyrocoelia pectoralis]|uniref:Uncharacterized protein n=1 Tax=Pyrocoelia pectoralis TaxID=417401 RepID=A0AAN7VGV0_9COLE
MSLSEVNQNTTPNALAQMESVDRFSHIPAVEQTVQVATTIYEKVKDYHYVTNWTLSTAETTVQKAIEISTPVVNQFEGPIKKVDGLLCSGLDYVEQKVPAVKLPPGEVLFQMYTSTKDYVNEKFHLAIQTARDVMEPAVQAALQVMEPAVKLAEPLVQPAMDTACALKHKVEEILHLKQSSSESKGEKPMECDECPEHQEKSIHSQ